MQTMNQTSNKASKAPEQSKAPESKTPEQIQAESLAASAKLAEHKAEQDQVAGPMADPVQAGAVAYRAALNACQTPAFYVATGKALARTAARKSAKSAILAAITGKLS